jgi:hypothetical protein
MTDIDQLLRDVLSTDAQTQAHPSELTARSMVMGRRLRQRRRVGMASVAIASVGVIVGGSLAVSDAVGNHDHTSQKVIVPAAGGSPKAHAKPRARTRAGADSTPWWQSWPTDRVYGDRPGAAYLTDPGTSTVYASGTLPDGTDFIVEYDSKTDQHHVPDFTQGWNGVPDFGEAVGEGPTAGPDAEFLSLESPTLATGGPGASAGSATSQWLVVVGRQGTTAASYSADGVTWQPMDVQNGIAVLKLPALAPTTAELELSDASGQYVDGPLVTP